MSDQKQHVDIHRKLMLRKSLLEKAPDIQGAFYIPFIGDGDIAVELYSDKVIYGADLDIARTETAGKRLSGAQVICADCDKYPFSDINDIFSVADFDSYSYPYTAFRTFWETAKKNPRMVLYFTDGQLQAITRTGHWTHPNGKKQNSKTVTERRAIANKYFTGTILPWFSNYISPWKVIETNKYKRGMMLYWGAVIESPEVENKNPSPVKALDGDKNKQVMDALFEAAINGNVPAIVKWLDENPQSQKEFTEAVNNNTDIDKNTNKKVSFIRLYPEYGTIGSTLKAIGIKSRTTFYNWLNDEKFNDIYENELKPNRRDDVVSVVYRVASGKMKIDSTQLTAAFGFLKATDHISEDITKDRLVFCEKNQLELTGKDGKPLQMVFKDVDPETKKMLSELKVE